MLIVGSDRHRSHHALEFDGTALIPSWESPARAESIVAALEANAIGPILVPDALDRQLVEAVHTPDYVEFLATAWDRWVAAGKTAPAAMGFAWPARGLRQVRPSDLVGQLGYHSFAADCSITAGTWDAVQASAAAAHTVADRVADDASSGVGDAVGFALCRPPGHHAGIEQFGGYCFLNNAAIAAQRLIDRGFGRVGLLDVDYHHGNGTQEIFYGRDDVVFCSLHGDPVEEFPWFLGHADEVGIGAGDGANKNLPLPRGTTAGPWFDALGEATAWLEGWAVDAFVVSLGVDTFAGDPISQFQLHSDDFVRLGRELAAMSLPTVLVMEGGYATAELGDNVAAVLAGFAGEMPLANG